MYFELDMKARSHYFNVSRFHCYEFNMQWIVISRDRLKLKVVGGGAENSIQLSPEGEVNSGGCIPRRKALRYISTALHPPWGNYSCFSIYQIRWIKKCCFN